MEMEQETPLRRLRIDLSAIDEIASQADEFLDDENAADGYVDTQTGEVHSVFRQLFRCLDGDLAEKDLPTWMAGELDTAKTIREDKEERFAKIERWDAQEDFRLVEEFTEATRNPRLRAELIEALQGPQPSRRFRDTLDGWREERSAWFSFLERAHREWARQWLHSLGIDAVDSSPRPPDPLPERW
jgi:hypothetical protein